MNDPRRKGPFYVCAICGAHFMLEATMWRHFYTELEGFRQFARDKRATWEAQRVQWFKDHPIKETGK